jgi:glycosyltransferase involved in cell wall biosynthesis
MDFSVVIPVHNAAAWIREAVASVAGQRHAPVEIVLVDDGSSDTTPEILVELEQRHPAVRVLRQFPARGPSAARNLGWRAASCTWVAFIDADDVWHPQHLAQFARMIRERPEVDVVYARTKSFVHTPDYDARPDGPVVLLEDAPIALLQSNPVPQSAVAVRRTRLLETGGYDEARPVVEDYDLWCRLASTATFASIASATVARRVHAGQLSERRAVDMYRLRWVVREQMQQRVYASGGPEHRARWKREKRALMERELDEAWRSRSLVILDAVLDACSATDAGEDIVARFRRRRLVWLPWRLAAAVYDALPPSLLAVLRKRHDKHVAGTV